MLRGDVPTVLLIVAPPRRLRQVVAVPYTLVSFHAHPDDAEITTGGTMARAKAEGHRVVLVLATRGELGEQRPGTVPAGETLGERRVAETLAAAKILGIDRVVFLDYRDSGMAGEPTNDADGSFWSADIGEAGQRLARVLQEEHADVLTTYDDHGGYGHPDHIQVHRVGARAAELAGGVTVYEYSMNRDHLRRLMAEQPERLADIDEAERPDPEFVATLGSPESLLTTTVDVRDYVFTKRAALAAHTSQVGPEHFFLAMPDDAFEASFGYEWYIKPGAPPGTRETSIFESLSD
jgi:LmbE family N-acetylglucosaminyl deacetylase